MREASSSQLAGLWTAACDAGIDRIPAVFGLPFAPLKMTAFSFVIMAERDNVGAALLLLFAGFHIGLTPSLFIFQDSVILPSIIERQRT